MERRLSKARYLYIEDVINLDTLSGDVLGVAVIVLFIYFDEVRARFRTDLSIMNKRLGDGKKPIPLTANNQRAKVGILNATTLRHTSNLLRCHTNI